MNLFGILTVKITENNQKYFVGISKFVLLTNILKFFGIFVFKNYSFILANENYENNKFEAINLFGEFRNEFIYFSTCLGILYQTWKSEEIVEIFKMALNIIRSNLRTYKISQKLYKELNKTILNYSLIMSFFLIIFFMFDFANLNQFSL